MLCFLRSPKPMSGRYLEEIIPRDRPGAGTGGGFGGGGRGAASGGRHAGFGGGSSGGGGRSAGFGRGTNRGQHQPQAHRGGVESKKRKGNSGMEITFDPAAVR